MTVVTRKAIPRRTVLRGLGAALALPLLDSMVPAFAATPAPLRRLGVIYVPNGVNIKGWRPTAAGRNFELTPSLQPFAAYREQMTVVTGLSSVPTSGVEGVHSRASTRFLTGAPPKRVQSAAIEAGPSMDQIVARHFAQETQLASLEIGLEGQDFAGACDEGYSCVYNAVISWRDASTPMPTEYNPRAVFERLFGDSGSTDPQVRLARMQTDRSLLDSVNEKIGRLNAKVGPRDRAKLAQYLDAVRDIERRIQKAEEQSDRELPVVDQPVGIPATFGEHAKLMFDLQVLAYQTDLTRVITMMFGRELSGRTFPEIGVHESHHPISHHSNDPVKLGIMSKINEYHARLTASYLDTLRATPDGDGSLLDHMILLFGYGMADSNGHVPNSLPLVVLGGGSGTLTPGAHLKFPDDTPVANLHLTLMDKLGVPIDRLGDSKGKVDPATLTDL